MMKLLYASLFYVCMAMPSHAVEISGKVNMQLAYKLMKDAGYSADEIMPPDKPISSDKPSTDSFFIAHKLGKYGGTIGWYAINPWTGDVWDVSSCKRLLSSALSEAQADIKNHFQADEMKEYERLHELHPYRIRDLEMCGTPGK